MWWWLPVLVACKPLPHVPAHTAPLWMSQAFDESHWVVPPPVTPAPERVFHDGFEGKDLNAWNIRRKDRTPLSLVTEGIEGAQALQLAAGEKARTLPAVHQRIEVEPDTLYRLSVQVQTEGLGAPGTVSYTHLTLPTKRIV